MDSKTKEILNRPFERALIKERIGPGGRVLYYVALGHYLARLNEAFEDGGWSYEITESKLLDDEALVQVRLTAAGTVKMAIGGAPITRRRDGTPSGPIHDLMIAESVAVKRCCRLFGIGAALYLTLDDEEPAATAEQAPHTGERQRPYEGATPSSPRITNAQLGKLRHLVTESGSDWTTFRNSVRERHRINIEYADRRLGSELIEELLGTTQHASNGNGHRNGRTNGWRR